MGDASGSRGPVRRSLLVSRWTRGSGCRGAGPSGGYLDPHLCEAACAALPDLLTGLDELDLAAALLDEEPHPHATVPDWRVEEVLAAFGDAVDLKAPMFHGHAGAVSRFAGVAAERLGLSTSEVDQARRAGAVADLGRAAIPTATWQRQTFTSADWGQARLHPYYSERVLQGSPLLAGVAPVAGAHHERLDGSGYYRRAAGSALSMPARVVACADALATRRAYSLDRAASSLAALAPTQLDPDAVEAVLAAADAPPRPTRRDHPAGLTERQVEVLCLVADGRSNREIGEVLGISPRTAEHHVQDVYAKLGVVGRAPAALFAMEHGLLGPLGGGPRPL
jgi:HD-GYP domain-containing protein (c-di-GMP phosphodiesterase class II)